MELWIERNIDIEACLHWFNDLLLPSPPTPSSTEHSPQSVCRITSDNGTWHWPSTLLGGSSVHWLVGSSSFSTQCRFHFCHVSGCWTVLSNWRDFTFVCPTCVAILKKREYSLTKSYSEILAYNDAIPRFRELNTAVFGLSILNASLQSHVLLIAYSWFSEQVYQQIRSTVITLGPLNHAKQEGSDPT